MSPENPFKKLRNALESGSADAPQTEYALESDPVAIRDHLVELRRNLASQTDAESIDAVTKEIEAYEDKLRTLEGKKEH